MQYLKISVFLLATGSTIAGATPVETAPYGRAMHLQNRQNNNQKCVDANVLQLASSRTGQEPGTDGIRDGQSPSATDDANFINFCSGSTITNGSQLTGGSCNSVPMGRIPATRNMISAMIINPQTGDRIPSGQAFDITVQTAHLAAGVFVNPTTNYYSAPQDLNKDGDIIGHCHVTVQEIGSLKSTTPPDPNKFAFFKGIDDDGNGRGLLRATVADGLSPGVYRVCTMIAASNHQPVLMPVAQRGAQDDCTKFEVVAAGGNQDNGQGKDNESGNANVGKIDSGKVDGKADDTDDSAGNNGQAPKNLQTFSGNLGVEIEPIEFSGDSSRPFLVGGSTFVNFAAAAQRSCDRQFNGCADVANGRNGGGISVGNCEVQKNQCQGAQNNAPVQSFSR